MSNSLKIGNGKIFEIETTLKENGLTGKMIYVSDEVVDSLYGDTVRTQIKNSGKLVEEKVNNNTIRYSMQLAERIIATEVDCIIGVGGGKVLDVCKYASYISKKPFLSVPTTLANDGIASPIAVLKREDNKPKSLGCAMPTMLLLDTDLILKSPLQLIKAGIGDTISNYMALKDWKFAVDNNRDIMNGYAYLMSQTALDALMKTQYTSICSEFVTVLANSLVLSGVAMDFSKSSRPVSGSEHLFSHALDYYSDNHNLHGIQVALGTVSVLKLIGQDYSVVLEYLKKFDVDINPSNLGISEKTFVLCMQKATSMRTNRYTYLHESDLSHKNLQNLYNELLEEL